MYNLSYLPQKILLECPSNVIGIFAKVAPSILARDLESPGPPLSWKTPIFGQ